MIINDQPKPVGRIKMLFSVRWCSLLAGMRLFSHSRIRLSIIFFTLQLGQYYREAAGLKIHYVDGCSVLLQENQTEKTLGGEQ